jgi:transketolase
MTSLATPSGSGSSPAPTLADLANAIRVLSIDAVEAAKSGHPGLPMGMADVATVLFGEFLKFDPSAPEWPDRDRFVLSAGHGSMLLYAILYLTGYADFPIETLKRFRQMGSYAAGHPEFGHGRGIETTTGPLGQGLATAVGMAIAERHLAARFGADLVDHRIYVLASDGDLMEGVSHEAASLAGHLGLNRLIVLFDDNHISIDGPTSLAVSDDHMARFESYGWTVDAVDGHDPVAIRAALTRAKSANAPVLIACRTVIGYGSPAKAGTNAIHSNPLGAEEIAATRAKLGWTAAPFVIPENIMAAWRAFGERGAQKRAEWNQRHEADDEAKDFDRAIRGGLPACSIPALAKQRAKFAADKPKIATRKASQIVIDALIEQVPELLGGSADLAESNLTKGQGTKALSRSHYAGRYLHYGVREHAMAAAMNGMALHGGVIPFGGTFLVFADYLRPALRLSALMGKRVIYVLTHDSIGLGEDGPTHQPVEHLASLRAMPNLAVFRPADAIETAECWELALFNEGGPSVLALSRQNLPPVRQDAGSNLSARGAYVLVEASTTPKVVVLATGSEVHLAVAACETLETQGVPTRVVSMPSRNIFEGQGESYRRDLLPKEAVIIAVEAGIGTDFDKYIGSKGAFIGMHSFGASAPADVLFSHFGITADAIVNAALSRL